MSAREIKLPPPQRFSRRWFAERARTALWVGVVTVLIWVFADIQVTKESDKIRGKLRIHASSGADTVLLSGDEFNIVFKVKGRGHAIDEFEKKLIRENSILRYDAAKDLKDLQPGRRHVKSVADILDRLPLIRNAGLVVISVNPKEVAIELDSLKLIKDVKVDFSFSGAELDGQAIVAPSKIDILVPASRAEGLTADNMTLATAMLDLRDEAPGKEVTREVAVQPPPGMLGAQLTPPTVKVTFKILQQTDNRPFTVNVQPKAPPAWLSTNVLSKYKLELKPGETWSREIKVSGNPIDLQKLRAEDIQAYIVLKDDDYLTPLASWLPGKVRVHFHEGLGVSLADGAIAPVMYKFVERKPPEKP